MHHGASKKSAGSDRFLGSAKIFHRLCIGFRRSGLDVHFSVRADDGRRELALSESIFAEALYGLLESTGEKTIECFEENGETYLRLGDSAKFNLTDWTEAD